MIKNLIAEQVGPTPVVSADLLVAGLRDVTAHLDVYIEQRAAELAQPLITAAVASAAKRIAEVGDQLRQEKNLTAELRRQVKSALRLAARLGHEAGQRHDKNYCAYCTGSGER